MTIAVETSIHAVSPLSMVSCPTYAPSFGAALEANCSGASGYVKASPIAWAAQAARLGERGAGPESSREARVGPIRDPEQHDRGDRVEQDAPPRVLEHIMADLVAGDGADLVERRVPERHVGDRDARSAADAARVR